MKTLRPCLLILVLAAAPGWAQQPKKLSLQSALGLAEKQNLDLLAARRRRAEALAGVQIARQRPNPSFSFDAARDFPHESITFAQPLEIGPKRRSRIQLAEQEAGLTDVDIEALARQVRRSAREAFYSLVEARAESERFGRVLQLAERLRQIAQQRFEAGDVARLEVIQAELEVSRAQADREVAQQREKVASAQLNAVLNEPADTEWEIAGSLSDALAAVTLPDLTQRAYGSNPELLRLAQEMKVEQSRLQLLKVERIPTVEVNFGSDFNAPGEFRAGGRGGLTLGLPIFSRNQGQIAQSLARQQTLEAETRALRRSVAGRVEAAYFDLTAQRTQVELYRQRLLPATQQLEALAEESYRAGRAGILVVLSAQRNVQEIERSYLESLFALQSSFAFLEATVGVALE